MTPDVQWEGNFAKDVQYGYLNEAVEGPKQRHPRVVLNSSDATVLRVLREEIKRCNAFTFSVAFVSPSALAMLKTDLIEFAGKGRIITSDYLAFNSPQAFAELLKLGELGFDVRLHRSSAFHPKGYIFDHDETVSAMVGSANLTASALVKNHEWNLLVSATKTGNLAMQLRDLVRQQILDSVPITQDWLDGYARDFTAPPLRPTRPELIPPDTNPVVDSTPTVEELEVGTWSPPPADVPARPWSSETTTKAPAPPRLLPNRMQRDAMREIERIRQEGQPRALVISATGTGKTILSALCVRTAKPRRMLFLVHREQILDRTLEEYHRVLGGDRRDFGIVSGSRRDTSAKYVFATVQSISQWNTLEQFDPEDFDYIVIDEAHRAAAARHRRVLDYFAPEFLLGMTATPERMDGFNIFELFDFNVPYEIRLNHALEEDMLSPFHYYGVADVTFDDGSTTDDGSTLSRLTSTQRVDHVVKALKTYGQAGIPTRGLIFVSRKHEAHSLSEALNERSLNGSRLRTVALTGEDSVARREAAVEELEAGLLDYIVTVDVFNEGVDIPSVNQVIMLRQTKSAIVFVQQLGRGLRKANGKEYLVVIDFIGNYTNNFMIPIALFGDESLNKESLRRNLIAAEERGVLAGLSSVQFERIAHERVLKAVTDVKLDSMRRLKTTLEDMQNRLGRTPQLWDFIRFESADPVVLANAQGNFPTLLAKALKADWSLTPAQLRLLTLLSQEVLTAKRPHDAATVRHLLDHGSLSVDRLHDLLKESWPNTTRRTSQSAVDTLTLAHHAEADVKRYQVGAAVQSGDSVELTEEFVDAYTGNPEFQESVDDLLRTAQHLAEGRYDQRRTFTPGRQYGRKEVARLLGWPRKWTPTIYGYRTDVESGVCPIFVTLHKSDDVSATTAYEDALVDHRTMVWYTRSRRTLRSAEVASIVRNEVALHVFVKKDDAEGTDFYYLGQATSSHAEETTMAASGGKSVSVVRMLLTFKESLPAALYDYFHPVVTRV